VRPKVDQRAGQLSLLHVPVLSAVVYSDQIIPRVKHP